MDPQLVALTETLGAGIEQHKNSSAFYREKGEGFVAAQAENKEKTDNAIAETHASVMSAVTDLGKNYHVFYVNSNVDESVLATGSSNSPFKYVRDALLAAPFGGQLTIVVPNESDTYFSDPADPVFAQVNWYGSLLTIRSANSGYEGRPTILFPSVKSNDGLKTLSSRAYLNCVLALSGVKLDNGLLIEGTTQGGQTIRSMGFLKVVTFQVSFICGDIPLFDSHLSGSMEAAIHSTELVKNPLATKTLLCALGQGSRFDILINGGFTVDGDIEDFFPWTQRTAVTLNTDTVITGNQ